MLLRLFCWGVPTTLKPAGDSCRCDGGDLYVRVVVGLRLGSGKAAVGEDEDLVVGCGAELICVWGPCLGNSAMDEGCEQEGTSMDAKNECRRWVRAFRGYGGSETEFTEDCSLCGLLDEATGGPGFRCTRIWPRDLRLD